MFDRLPSAKVICIALAYASVLIAESAITDRYLKDAITSILLFLIFNIYTLSVSGRDVIIHVLPSVVILNYLLVSLIVGSLGFYGDAVVVPYMKSASLVWESSIIPNLFLATLVSIVMALSRYKGALAIIRAPTNSLSGIIIALLLVYILLGFGLLYEYVFLPQVITSYIIVYIIYVFSLNSQTARLFCYLIVFLPFSLLMSQSKREAVFLFYPVIVAEIIIGRWTHIKIRHLALAVISIACLSGLVLAMTVLRVPEVFNIQSVWDVPGAVLYYIEFENFIAYFLLNIEATYTYFHVMNAIDMSIKGQIPLLWGETYIKPLFIWVPRIWIEWKPRSAVDHYTSVFDPTFRLAGGSWAISALGEAYLNFKIFGAMVLAIFLNIFDRVFIKYAFGMQRRGLLYAVGSVYFGVAILNFARGSGLDIAVIQFIIVVASALPLALILNYGNGSHRVFIRASKCEGGVVNHRELTGSSIGRTMPLSRHARARTGQ